MDALLEIKNLSKHYKGFTLSGINLNVSAGTIVGLVGSNGAGKTTTIKSVLGLVQPSAGTIKLFGEPAGLVSNKQRLGVVLDHCSVPESIRVCDASAIMAASYEKWNQSTFENYLTRFELPRKKIIKKLSRGMGMKLSLACALSHDPDLLILDEATSGLDPLMREEILDLLRTFVVQEGRGILMSTHITSDLEKIADHVICVDKGKIVFSVTRDDITDKAGIAQCREAEFEQISSSGFFETGTMRFVRHAYDTTVLVPNRLTFTKRFPKIAVERATIDAYMQLTLKGETR